MRFATLLLLAAALLPGASRMLHGQAPSPATIASAGSPAADSAGFHTGQWGFLVAVDRDFRSLGVQRFRSARTAWMLDLALGGAVVVARGTPPTESETRAGQAHLATRVGLRRYTGFGTRTPLTHRFVGAGVSAHTSYLQGRGIGDELMTGRTSGGGVFGEVGLQHRVAPFLALGGAVTARVDASWQRLERRSSGVVEDGPRSRSLGASVGNPVLFGVIYF